MYDEENNTKGIILATILCALVIIASRYLFPQPEQPAPAAEAQTNAVISEKQEPIAANTSSAEEEIYPVEQVLQQNPRIKISNAAVKGSIRVEGARFDDLMLDKYKQTLSPDSPDVELLTPAQTESPYFAEFGWLSTQWQVKGKELTPDSPIVLEWNNGQGLRFVRTITLDKNYMFSIADSVDLQGHITTDFQRLKRQIAGEGLRTAAQCQMIIVDGVPQIIRVDHCLRLFCTVNDPGLRTIQQDTELTIVCGSQFKVAAIHDHNPTGQNHVRSYGKPAPVFYHNTAARSLRQPSRSQRPVCNQSPLFCKLCTDSLESLTISGHFTGRLLEIRRGISVFTRAEIRRVIDHFSGRGNHAPGHQLVDHSISMRNVYRRTVPDKDEPGIRSIQNAIGFQQIHTIGTEPLGLRKGIPLEIALNEV